MSPASSGFQDLRWRAAISERPAASARAFVADPFALPHDVDRIAYRTGDLVKMSANGDFVFLRRIDRQLKLRGHRIEPIEIEGALQRQDGVEDAVVVLAGDAESQSLVAFVTTSGCTLDARVEPDTLRISLARTLPSAMVPSAIVVLAALPTTAAGKVDRERFASAQRRFCVSHRVRRPTTIRRTTSRPG